MFESVKNIWTNLEAVGYHPWITVFGVALYFAMRKMIKTGKGTAILVVLFLNLIGQAYYVFPKTPSDILGTIFFSVGQAVVAFGVYSAIDWLWSEGMIQSKIRGIFSKGTSQGPTP